ncbi:DUF7281 domain-containing protein [Alcaligenes endophyticus]|uniref:DUF7281 domain-containing protein n=1 Tax=Alcaligenes endophyticus TaxID=1929088 RepID=A0ABT8EH87_9BURK|nr:hypothetical protein [Alcaligenes endophyticus]MCX5589703.1 hypothetical protein [Alcaligenes endophyticus]MDN4120633.1 hypothetical protein [Alcaligenes endophyticus]
MQTQELAFLQKLLLEAQADPKAAFPLTRQLSRTAEAFSQHHRIGLQIGKRFEYRADDLARAQALIRSHALPLQASSTPLDRAQASFIPGRSEKHTSLAPHHGEIAILPLSSGCLYQGQPLPSHLPGYMVITEQDGHAIQTKNIVVVENFETFVQLRRYHWLLNHPAVQQASLAVFRGDNLFKANHALAFLHLRREPVWAFPDFDPAGLGWTLSMPRFAGLLFPWEGMRERLLRHNRTDLYHASVAQWEQHLTHSSHVDIQRAWQLMHSLWRGLNQEALRDI